ncbi:hypothetical protein Cgig2_013005 [Carnegiea gigantea]|uniref:separase n=1 Tax=Carnegiea gigantea TaxID=171969 RepID=A0A9Q1K8V5_9CARY|nr:hypothetical protein Cgig2_013005 [Carnegiea gigantea]
MPRNVSSSFIVNAFFCSQPRGSSAFSEANTLKHKTQLPCKVKLNRGLPSRITEETKEQDTNQTTSQKQIVGESLKSKHCKSQERENGSPELKATRPTPPPGCPLNKESKTVSRQGNIPARLQSSEKSPAIDSPAQSAGTETPSQPSRHDSRGVNPTHGSEAAAPNSMTTDTFTLLRVVPQSVEEIEACVENFFRKLPSTTILCISLLEDSCTGLLQEILHYPSNVYGWLLLSQLDGDNQPAVSILPLSSILQGEETSFSHSVLQEKHFLEEWNSPWGCRAVVDDLAPLFEQILRLHHASSSNLLDQDTEQNRKVWWLWRENLDSRLHTLLRNMEESWFGAWRFLLLGRWLDCWPLNSLVRELVCEIKLRFKYDINEGVLKLVLGGIKPANLANEGIPSLFLQKGCYIGCIEDHDGESCNLQNEACNGADYVPACIIELMLTAVSKLEAEYCTHRKPVILVLDSNVQMLPLESMPILREQEVYRMPSVAIIFATLQRSFIFEEAVSQDSRFPLIDPLDAFYLLNPSGDLSRTQAEFEEWFRCLNMQGKTAVVPSKEELTGALENHDLFYYLGHGNGSQYIPKKKIGELEKCAAMLLMGCSSASLTLNGDYPQVGPSLSYILAGSPIMVGNLWDFTDGEIDRFAKALLKAFLIERSTSSSGCMQCSILAEELKSMSVNERKGNTKKGRGRKKKPES